MSKTISTLKALHELAATTTKETFIKKIGTVSLWENCTRGGYFSLYGLLSYADNETLRKLATYLDEGNNNG